jgi:hypothetical protein
MPRQKSSIKLSGKIDDEVYVNGKYGQLVRKAPKKGAKKNKTALKQQYNRTAFLNTLASELNRIIGAYSGILKNSSFYHAVQKRFRKEPLNNRFLLLKQLEGMEVNSDYPLNKLGNASVTVHATEKKITVRLDVLYHVPEYLRKYKVDCYTYELSLLCWKKGEGPPTHARQFSEWTYITDGLPEFEFVFTRPAGTVHWLVVVKQQAGLKEEPVNSFVGEGMRIISAGTFDKKDLALLDKRKEEEMAKETKEPRRKTEEQIIRVKAKAKRKL